MIGFRQLLTRRQVMAQTLLCVGLDPDPKNIPMPIRQYMRGLPVWTMVLKWMIAVVDLTAPYTCMFKPQSAFYEGFDNGRFVLQELIKYIREHHPNIPIFLDCKRGDIANTQQKYGVAHLDMDGVDGMNTSPYMGSDTISALSADQWVGRSLVALCFTSNPSAREIQEIVCADGRFYYEHIAELALSWFQMLKVTADAGLVMAAAFERDKGSGVIDAEHLRRVRAIVGDLLWFLMPGVGKQGGAVLESVKYGYAGAGSMAINSSSGISNQEGEDWYEKIATAACKQASEIMNAMAECGYRLIAPREQGVI